MKSKSGENFLSLIICLIFMGIFGLATVFFSPVWGLIQILCAILLSVIFGVIIKRNHGRISDYIENITFHADNATKESLIYAPMPVIIVRRDGRILWYNKNFDELFEGKELFDTSIEQVFEHITVKDLFSKPNIEFTSTISGRHFDILGNSIRIEKKDEEPSFVVLYLFDDTINYKYDRLYHDEQSIIGIVNIDNYDDVLMNTPDTYRSLLIAEIENKINTWYAFTKGIMKKIERDRYLIVFHNKYLKQMIDSKFPILESVKEVKCGNKFSPTLSIGIGVENESYQVADEYANSAVTLALGRGGDQVVIKDKDNVMYFGGKTREHEKTTKVKARITALALRELMDHASEIIIMGHKYPDMDAIGAAVGICAFARSVGKQSHIVYDYNSPSVTGMLNRIQEQVDYSNVIISRQYAIEHITKDTLLVVVDTHRPDYTDCAELLSGKSNVVLIDHHRRGADFINNANLVYHEPYASSTCEMVAELLQYAGDKLVLNSTEAEAIYAGIMLDTKDFAMKTGVRTFEAAAYLKRCGVDIGEIRKFFRNDFNSFVNVAQIVAGAKVVKNNIAISECKNIEGVDMRAIAPQAADKLLSISGIEASFVILPMDDETAISGRSTGNINVQLILEKLGGGGHQTMSGVQLPPCSFKEAKKRLLEAIDEYMAEQEE